MTPGQAITVLLAVGAIICAVANLPLIIVASALAASVIVSKMVA